MPCAVSTGNKFVLIGVAGQDDLKSLRPDFERMFAPNYGINEESAPGMAAGPSPGCSAPNSVSPAASSSSSKGDSWRLHRSPRFKSTFSGRGFVAAETSVPID